MLETRGRRAATATILFAALAAGIWVAWPASREVPRPAGSSIEHPQADPGAVEAPSPASLASTGSDAARRSDVVQPPAWTSTEPPAASRPGLRLVDQETRRPVSGVRVFDLRSATAVGASGADGHADVDPAALDGLGFAPNDRHYPCLGVLVLERVTQLPDGSKQLALVRDGTSVRLMFRFVDRTQRPVPGVRFTIEPEGEIEPAGSDADWRGFVQAVDMMPVLSTAWVGPQNPPRAFRTSAEGEAHLRFAMTGTFRVSGRSPDDTLGFDTTFTVRAHAHGRVEVIADTGMTLAGTIVSERDGRPVEAAEVRANRVSTTSDAGGWFALGPFTDRVQLEVSAYGFHRWSRQDVEIREDTEIELVPRPEAWIELEVKSAGAISREIKSATAELLHNDRVVASEPILAGQAVLRMTGASAVLRIRAAGWNDWRAYVDSETRKVVCEMLPATAQGRLDIGATGVVRGTLRDRKGAPAAGVALRAISNRAYRAPFADSVRGGHLVGLAGLRLDGGVGTADCVTDSEGRFAFEFETRGVYEVWSDVVPSDTRDIVRATIGSFEIALGEEQEKDLVLSSRPR